MNADQKRLLRTEENRMIWGVAGGLGRYFGVDPIIFRIGFGVSIFLGGLGLLAYAALALFVPSGDGEEVKPAPYERSRWLGVLGGVALVCLAIPAVGSPFFWGGDWGWNPWDLLWIGILFALAYGLYALYRGRGDRGRGEATGRGSRVAATILMIAVALILFPALAFGAVYVTATGNGIWAAALVAIMGVILLVSATRGGARWVIVPAVFLAAVVGGTAAADIRFPSSIGEREYRPTEASSIPDDGYEIGLGRLLVDLRDVHWTDDQVVSLDVEVGFGQADVVVPESVCVAADAHAGAGELVITGERSDGVDVDSARYLGTTATPLLLLKADIDAGQIRVINDDDAELGDREFGHDDIGDDARAEQRATAEEACAETEPDAAGSDRPTHQSEKGGAHKKR
jgi:phage shock protein PspC (stress-responsive transcriptional regulator)